MTKDFHLFTSFSSKYIVFFFRERRRRCWKRQFSEIYFLVYAFLRIIFCKEHEKCWPPMIWKLHVFASFTSFSLFQKQENLSSKNHVFKSRLLVLSTLHLMCSNFTLLSKNLPMIGRFNDYVIGWKNSWSFMDISHIVTAKPTCEE